MAWNGVVVENKWGEFGWTGLGCYLGMYIYSIAGGITLIARRINKGCLLSNYEIKTSGGGATRPRGDRDLGSAMAWVVVAAVSLFTRHTHVNKAR